MEGDIMFYLLTNKFTMLFFGIAASAAGFINLKKKRLIENTPTSKIRSLSMGLVELKGKAYKIAPLTAPITGAKCCFFKYLVQKHEQRGKNSRWVTVASGSSEHTPFYLEDETGKIIVDPRGVDAKLDVKYKFCNTFGRDLPANCSSFLTMKGIYSRGFIFKQQFSFSEWRIDNYEQVYLLGTAKKTHWLEKEMKQSLIDYIRQVKKDAGKMKKFDLNGDGNIDAEEWEAAQSAIEAEYLEKQSENTEEPDETLETCIAKGDQNKNFIISDKSEKELCSKYNFYMAASFLVSFAAIAFSVYRFIR